MTLSQLQKAAKDASSWIGTEAESEIDDLWSRHSSTSGGETSGGESCDWRTKQEEYWVKKLTRACQPRRRGKHKQTSEKNEYLPVQDHMSENDERRLSPPRLPQILPRSIALSESASMHPVPASAFDITKGYLWTCIPAQLASRIGLSRAPHVTSLQSLLFAFSPFRTSGGYLQAVIFVEEPVSVEAACCLQDIAYRVSNNGDMGNRDQIWVHRIPRISAPPGYKLEALSIQMMRKL